MKTIIKSNSSYIVKAENCSPVLIRKAQDKHDAIKKAEGFLGKELINPGVKVINFRNQNKEE
jgi:hypothetical protein